MARSNRYPEPIDQTICEAVALPNATRAKISTNVLTLDSRKQGNLVVRVFASNNAGTGTTVELASSATLVFELNVGATAAACTTVLPGGFYAKQGVTSDVSWAEGELMAEFIVPKYLIGTNKYAELYASTSADESADYVEAYLYVE